jgi:hypothetical protein
MIDDPIMQDTEQYIRTGEQRFLKDALEYFCKNQYGEIFTALLEVSKHYAGQWPTVKTVGFLERDL